MVDRRVRLIGVVGLVATITGIGVVWAGRSTASPSGAAPATGVANVVRADLAADQSIAGTIGYDGSWTVVLPGGTAVSALTQAQQKITTDQLALSAATTSVADTRAADNQAIAQAQAAIAPAEQTIAADENQRRQDDAQLTAAQAKQRADCAAPSGSSPSPACVADQQATTQAQARDASDSQGLAQHQSTLLQATGAVATVQQHAAQADHQAGAEAAGATAALQADQANLATMRRTALTSGASFTWLPAPGQVIIQGQPLYALDGHPVPLLYGTEAAWRAFQHGMDDGADVDELNRALAALGFETGPSPGAHFTDATASGIRRLQLSEGLAQTGVLQLGDVVFLPTGLRISGVATHGGSPSQPGTPVLTGTSTSLVVTALVPVANVGSVKVGDAVTVDLPDGRTGSPGRVRDVGSSVTTGSGGGGSGSGGSGSGGSGSGGSGSGATDVPATVVLADPSVATGLDQAAVLVHITTRVAHGVLAVPVEALLALSGGGEGVEVVSDGARRIVPVQTGVFTGTQVEIQSTAISVGTQVEVPAR